MAYQKQTWLPGPQGGTPLSAPRLNHMEDGIAAAATAEELTAGLGTRAPAQHTHAVADLAETTEVGRDLMRASTAGDARSTIASPRGTGVTEIRALTQEQYDGLASKGAATLYVIVAEAPGGDIPDPGPVAAFTFTAANLTVAVDASTSSGSPFGAEIVSYAWDFGDGSTGTGVTATHSYTAAGPYPITLTVTDDQGQRNSTTQSVSVTAPNPQTPQGPSPTVYSLTANRAAPQPLTGASITASAIYVFVPEIPSAGIARVDFDLNDGARTYGEAFAPYDLMGAGGAAVNYDALPLDTSTLGAGDHKLVTVVQYTDGTTKAWTDTFSVAATTPIPGPEPGVPDNDLDASYMAAFNTRNIETVRQWFLNNLAPRRSQRAPGTIGAVTVSNQTQANAIRNRVITGRLTVNGPCTIEQITMLGADIRVTGGADLTLRHCLLDGGGNTNLVGMMDCHQNAKLRMEFIEIVRHYDGLRLYSTGGMSGKYIFMHSMATSNPRNHHQDGIQQMAGDLTLDNIFIDGRGANTSTFMVKTDVGPAQRSLIRNSTLFGAPWRAHPNNSGGNVPQNVSYAGNLTGEFGNIMFDLWQMPAAARAAIEAQQVYVQGKGLRNIRHGTRTL